MTTQHHKAAWALACLGLGLPWAAQAQEVQARVLSSTPLLQAVTVPQTVCRDEVVQQPGARSGAGALMGGVAGAALGQAVGNGSGRAAATFIGLIGGAVLGNQIEGPGQPYAQTVQRCSTQNLVEQRTTGYQVVYEWQGQRHTTVLAQDPGPWLRLGLSPVQAAPPVQQHRPPVYQAPQTYLAPAAPVVVHSRPHYLPAPVLVLQSNWGQARPHPVIRHPVQRPPVYVTPPARNPQHRGSGQRGEWNGRGDRGDRSDHRSPGLR